MIFTQRAKLVTLAALVCGALLVFISRLRSYQFISFNESDIPIWLRVSNRSSVPRYVYSSSNFEQQQLPSPFSRTRPLNNEVTIVTAFVNIGRFQKGEGNTFFTPNLYHKWMNVFSRINNPLIAFMETDEDVALFQKLRSNLPQNKSIIVQFSRNNTWAFSLRPKIAAIYSQKDYPKHHPNTVVPEYSCAMHAKYEFMLKAASDNPFRTKYFSWLDIGLFRDIASSSNKSFRLTIPPNFEEKKVAYTQVYPRDSRRKVSGIFRENHVWVCGCYFVANAPNMISWAKIYMESVKHYLAMNLMNTDQQVLYSMFNEKRSSIDLQLYKGDGRFNAWFHLGYLSKVEELKH